MLDLILCADADGASFPEPSCPCGRVGAADGLNNAVALATSSFCRPGEFAVAVHDVSMVMGGVADLLKNLSPARLNLSPA